MRRHRDECFRCLLGTNCLDLSQAVAHLVRFLHVFPKLGKKDIPTLGPAVGDRRVIATEGDGRLEKIDGTRVLFLKGSPEAMGRQPR